MDQVKFMRGTKVAIEQNGLNIPDGAFCYAVDAKELSMKMGNDLIPLDNAVYWVLAGETRLLPSEVNRHVAYDFNDNNFYIAHNNRWYKASRDASISAGTLML